MKDKNKTTITFLGDLMCDKELILLSKSAAMGTYDFKPLFTNVKPYLQKSDYVIGNLETPIDSKYGADFMLETDGYNSPPEYLEALIDAGVKLYLTGNNHTYDYYGEKGLLTTLNMLNFYGMDHIGTYATPEDAEKIFIKEINGIKIAFLNYTFGINYNVHGNLPPKIKNYQINFLATPEYHELEDWWNLFPFLLKYRLPTGFHRFLLHSEKIYNYSELTNNITKKIADAKELGAELIVLIPHFGIECVSYPLRFVRKWCEMMFKAGADVIIGGHPHTLQPMEYRELKDCFGMKKNRFLIYSLGNFISQEVSYCPCNLSMMSIILNVNIEKDSKTSDVNISSVSCIPIWIHAESKNEPAKVYVLSDEIKKAHDKENTEQEMKLLRIKNKIHSIITDDSNSSINSWVFYPHDLQHKEKWIYSQDLKYIFTRFPKQVFGTVYQAFVPHKIRRFISQKR